MTLLKLLGAGLAALCVAASVSAQNYPASTVKMVVPYAAGGATDVLGRLIAQRLSATWGQPVVVENKTGANGMIGAEQVAKSPADGYTLLLVVPGHIINPSIFAKSPYDVIADFTPVTQVASSPWLVVASLSVPAANLQELIALARSQPGKLAFGSSEPSTRLAGELFKQMAGVDLLNVPYKGGAHAVASRTRIAAMPDVPTSAEAGLPGYETGAWYGLYAPAKTPKEVVAKIQQDIAEQLKRPEVLDRLKQMGATPVGSTPEAFAAFTRTEYERYAKVVRAANIKPE
jgi:tripartite-type tricarboxylate transporter receptor subunit TctC